ncbi:uncharacterized protein LOC129807460 [Phlebotomus papatasi]|uniref:uncharacterized protein LOC129807460 n=1 Tax=Phlebotomus papatasi TaxID=29031 RepID=UPI0024834F4D|nr:uncharacterized protein LOC129807460 [Phlebotomus papatasi]
MGKFTKIPQQRPSWSTDELKSIDAARVLVHRIEKHESLVRNSELKMKSCSRKLKDLMIRRNIMKDYNPEANVFPAFINSHVQESLNWEIVQKRNELEDIVDNLSKSLKSTETAIQDVEKDLQTVLLEEENLSNHQKDLINLLNYILDASLSIHAYYTTYQMNMELNNEMTREENSAQEDFHRKDDSREFSHFIRDFLCRCRLEKILNMPEDACEGNES